MCTGRAELLTSPIIPVTSPGIEPTVDFCESAVFYHRAINATRPCELNSSIRGLYSTMVKDRALTGSSLSLEINSKAKICHGNELQERVQV
jgi:hypothetical protein